MLTLDFIAKRYGKLPSEVMANATTFDMQVADLAAEYQSYVYNKSNNGGVSPPPKLTQEQMNEMLSQARKKNENPS